VQPKWISAVRNSPLKFVVESPDFVSSLGNDIGDEGCLALAEALKVNQSVNSLNLRSMKRDGCG